MCLSHLIYTVRLCLIHNCHAMLRPCRSPAMPQHSTPVSRRLCCAVALRTTAWSEHGMAIVNQTRPHCVNQMGKAHSKSLAARHGRGTAWARRANGMLCANWPIGTRCRPNLQQHISLPAKNIHRHWMAQHSDINFIPTNIVFANLWMDLPQLNSDPLAKTDVK